MTQTAIRNSSNQIIGYIIDHGTHQEVRNKNYEIIGRVINGQTRDKHGNIVSWQNNPGLLFGDL